MWRQLILIFLFSFSSPIAWGQSPYGRVDGRDALLSAGGAGLFGTSILLSKKVEPLRFEDLPLIESRQNGIPGIDRWVSYNWSVPAHRLSNGFLYSAPALPLALALDGNTDNQLGRHMLIAYQGLLLNFAFTQLTKVGVRRTRPFVYNPDAPQHLKLKRDARLSFFSGHTSTVACMSFTTARMYTDINEDSRNDPLVWASASVLPAITGYLRIRAGKHFLTDVLLGYAVGAAIGLVVPRLHR